MARGGNDREDALAELAERYQSGVGNAEELISGVLASRDQELAAASNKRVDEAATNALTQADVAKAAGVDEDKVEGYAVRGDHLVVVYTNENNRSVKKAYRLKGRAQSKADKADDEGAKTGPKGTSPQASGRPS